MASLKSKLDELRESFPQFLRDNDDLHRGKVVSYREVKSRSLEYYFLRLRDHKFDMAMGIMFHGTSRSNIASICQNGMNDFSYFTNSLHYAMHRSEVREESSCKLVEVLVMAVIVEESDWLGQKEAKLRHPTYEYSLPLYIITVKKD